MATVLLQEDPTKQAKASVKGTGKGIQEILFFPAINKDLNPENEERVSEFWALDVKKLEVFNKETEKYLKASEKLAIAKEKLKNAQKDPVAFNALNEEILEIHEEIRQLFKDENDTDTSNSNQDSNDKEGNEKKKEDTNPVKLGSFKNLIECTGAISKKTYHISVKDLVKVRDTKAKHNAFNEFRFKTNMFDNSAEAKTMYHAFYEILTDSNDGTTDDKLKKQKESDKKEKNSKVIEVLKKVRVEMTEKWDFGKVDKKEGTLKLGRIKRFIKNDAIRNLLIRDEVSEVVDSFSKYVNENARLSISDKTNKRDQIIELLEKPENEFDHYHWNKAMLGIKNLWQDTDKKFVSKVTTGYPKIPLNLSDRKKLIKLINDQKLPPAYFNATAGAQLMRYTANAGGVAEFNFKEGKAKVAYKGDAQFSLAEASAGINLYLPHEAGAAWAFKVDVRKETYSFQKVAETELLETNPLFVHDSFLVLPQNIKSITEQVANLNFRKIEQSDAKKEFLIQVVGHTDSSGSTAYNKALGYNRAHAVHAFFTNNHAQWVKNFDENKWGAPEREMMELALYMSTFPDEDFEKVMNLPVSNTGKIEDDLAQKVALASQKYFYKKEMPGPVKFSGINLETKSLFSPTFFQDLLSSKQDTPNIQDLSNRDLVILYFQRMQHYALRQVSGVRVKDFRYFYVDEDIYPVISKGEEELKEEVKGKIAANRRVSLNVTESVRETKKVEEEIDLGKGRMHVEGNTSAFVGASVELSTSFEVNTYKGVAQLVGKKKETKDKQTEYKNGVVVAKDENKNNPSTDISLFGADAGGKGSAFAGAKIQGSIGVGLEWDNPDDSEKKFNKLASVGGALTGTAGVGVEGEFKIGYDSTTGTFQVKLKANATWGFGGGGALSFSVGVMQLYDFAVLVYKKLEDKDFNFLDIFENETNTDGTKTESSINVYELYIAWINELWQQDEFFKAGTAALLHNAALGFGILQKGLDLIEDFNKYKVNRNNTENMAQNIIKGEGKQMLQYVPPKVKGRMLYQLAEYKYNQYMFEGVQKVYDTVVNKLGSDAYSDFEEAAKTILFSMKHAREWQEAMEHMAMKTADGKGYQAYDKTVANSVGRLLRIQESKQFLQNELLTDTDDWLAVENHIKNIPGLKKLWQTKAS
ncbi:OmpA family protein [Tenacibaculum geojense]|uniref:OmpA family protein n=1 Tax=Tenacibaculum geojense TaxID=915352 RepID=A0ABW3JQ31_9FLAO